MDGHVRYWNGQALRLGRWRGSSIQLLTHGASNMKTHGYLLSRPRPFGGLVFLLPLVLLVVIVGKAFNIVKTLSTPAANLISAEKFAGYAVADLLAITVLLFYHAARRAVGTEPRLRRLLSEA